ncbi:helix-turn-helix transcriptional regulator [Alicyclobacillus dauci]|uniref:AraC family transcriptional regulator n=1 Tax=Alicyclobacillus dauci TaxID=1475485 RepID=A0ABY6Z5E7_9BACL|nr:AraC family transcriptional regulator [Alicyclobacillus dauci]WAH38086.1 AraC family transcriptional regulator [Alicyclobacillus dauci]
MDIDTSCRVRGARVLDVGYAEHQHPYRHAARQGLDCYLFRLQTDGRARALVDNHMMYVEAGDLLMFGPGEAYDLQIDHVGDEDVQSTDLYLFCDGEWIDEWWRDRQHPTHAKLPLHENCVHLWRQLIEEHRRPGGTDTELCDYLLRALCLTVDKMAYDAASTASVPLAAERMRWFIERNAPEDITLKDVADEVGLSVSRAVHIFKETYQQTIVQYLLDVRLQMACDRMRFSTFNLEQIADACGFKSYSYFYRVFRSRYGISPRAFRQRAL